MEIIVRLFGEVARLLEESHAGVDARVAKLEAEGQAQRLRVNELERRLTAVEVDEEAEDATA